MPAGAEALADAEMPAGAEPQAASEPTAAAAATLAQGKSFDDTIASFSSEERPKRSGPLAENNLSTAGGIIKWLLSTIAILGVIVLFAFLLKKSRLVQRSVGPMRLEAQMAVGPKERVVQLQVGERHILLGVTANSVNFLMDLTESEAPAEPEAQVATPKPTTAYTREEFDRFAAQFMAYMQENRASASAAAGAAAGSAASSAAFSEVFAQAYDRTTQTAQEAGLMGAQLAPEPAQVSPAGAQATPAADAPNAKDELSQAPVDGAQVLAALKNTPWVADTELAPDDSENLPPLPEGLSKGTTPEEVPAENAKEQRVDGK